MKQNSLWNLYSQFNHITSAADAFVMACVIELMHKNGAVKNRLNDDFASDVAYCAETYKFPKNIRSEVVSSVHLRDDHMQAYKDVKAACEWDENESNEVTLNRLISSSEELTRSYMHFSEFRFSKAVSEWICDGKDELKSYFPHNTLVEAQKYIGLNSKENCLLSNSRKSAIDCMLMALADVSINIREEVFEKLSVTQPDYYDVGFSFPPMGLKLDNKTILEDFVIENMLSSIKGRFACIVPAGFAFRSSSRSLAQRKSLVDSKRIASVVGLPAGFVAGTAVNTVAILFDQKGSENDEILMIDLADAKYRDDQLSSRSNFVLNEEAIKVFQDALEGTLGEKCERVAIEQIANEGYSLLPSKYALSEDMKLSLEMLDESKCSKSLSEIATLYRAQATKSDETGDEYFEIGASDINEYGFVRSASKCVNLLPESKCLKNKLQKNDIIFSIKGSVGKVALIDCDVDNWIVNQSFVIIRITDGAYTPQYVFRLLKSKAARNYVDMNSTGAIIKAFPIDKLKDFKLRDPSEESLTDAKEKTERQISLLAEMERMKKELSEIDR